jgi:hypothetical protein
MLVQAFRDEAAVTLFGGCFAAEETAGRLRKEGLVERIRDVPLVHQSLETPNVAIPLVIAAIAFQDIVCRGEDWQVVVFALKQAIKEVGEVFLFRETGELTVWIEPDIEQSLNTVFA